MPKPFPDRIIELNEIVQSVSIESNIENFTREYPGQVTFSTSFSFEDQLVTDIILKNNFPVKIFTLDTGRLFKETYSVWSATNERYNTHIKPYYPDHNLLEPFVEKNGPNSFYESVDQRKA